MAKLASQLPKGDGNGLQALVSQFIEDPKAVHVVIAVVDCSKIVTDTTTGDVEPTVRIRRIEPVYGLDRATAERMLLAALEERTGMVSLAFNHDTGEIYTTETDK